MPTPLAATELVTATELATVAELGPLTVPAPPTELGPATELALGIGVPPPAPTLGKFEGLATFDIPGDFRMLCEPWVKRGDLVASSSPAVALGSAMVPSVTTLVVFWTTPLVDTETGFGEELSLTTFEVDGCLTTFEVDGCLPAFPRTTGEFEMALSAFELDGSL